MAAAVPVTEIRTFRQFAFLNFQTALDAFMAVTKADPQGNIPISHDVINHRVQVSEADGNTVQDLLHTAGINVSGETVNLPVEDVWIIEPAGISAASFEDFADDNPGLRHCAA